MVLKWFKPISLFEESGGRAAGSAETQISMVVYRYERCDRFITCQQPHRVVSWYKLGHDAEEIARRYGHITVAQVYAALAYTEANRAEIHADLAAEAAEADWLEAEHIEQPAV